MNIPKKIRLSEFAKNVFSQFGEDGIIQEIFKRLQTDRGFCIEFGAWDGLHLSNTANLWKNGWEALLIEADIAKMDKLITNTAGTNAIPYHCLVKETGPDSLPEILRKLDLIRTDIHLISIDVDGDDYYLFGSAIKLKPWLVLVEYNPTLPPDIPIVQTAGGYAGASVRAFVMEGEKHGYTLVATSTTNCFFLRNDLLIYMQDVEIEFSKLIHRDYLNYIVTGYDGRTMALKGKECFGILGSLPETTLMVLDDGYSFTPIESFIPKHVIAENQTSPAHNASESQGYTRFLKRIFERR